MNPAIREWIQANHQPWRASPAESVYGGVLGSEGALPLDIATQEYFVRRGVGTDGRVFEDLLEADLLAVAEKVASWMTKEDRKKFDQAVAFGMGDTLEPNACAMTCLDGYAILFDTGFHTLLAQAIELQLAVMQKMIRPDELPLILNLAIATTFFHAADPVEYRARKPKVTSFQRRATDHVLWFVSLFFVGHEAGHIMLDHLEDAPKRGATLRSHPGLTTAEVLKPAHLEELAADRYSSALLFEGEKRGELTKGGSDQAQYWSSGYVNLGWVFSILGAVERMSERLGIKLSDTHPPAAKRWESIAGALRQHSPIPERVMRLDERLRTAAIEAAESGELPEIRKDWLETRKELVAFPLSLLDELATEEGTNRLPAREVLEAWISSPTPAAAMAVLRGHPEMLDAEVEAMHYGWAKAESDEVVRRDILVNKLLVLHRCIEVGIKKAFDEYEAGTLGVRSNPLPAYDACGSVEPAVLVENASEALKKLFNAHNAEEIEAILEGHPELQHPAADLLLMECAPDQPNESARNQVEATRIILAVSKKFTAFRALLEARARLPQIIPAEERSGKLIHFPSSAPETPIGVQHLLDEHQKDQETDRMRSVEAFRAWLKSATPDQMQDALEQEMKQFMKLREAEEDQETDWMPSIEVINAWLGSTTPGEAQDILRQHPELLHPKVDLLHYGLAREQEHEAGRAHILLKRLLLLQRCREIGIAAAFEELGGLAILRTSPMPGLEISSDILERFRTAHAAADEKCVNDMLASEPKLAALVNLPQTVKLLVETSGSDDPNAIVRFIEVHPELLQPAANRLLAELAASQTDASGKRLVEALRMILARCREVGVFRAILETRVRMNL